MLIPVSIIIPYFLQSSLPDGGGEGTQVQVQGQYGCILPPLPSPGWLVGGGASFATSRNPRPWRLPIEMLAACNYSAIVLSCRLLYSHLSHPSSPPWKEEEESHV